LAPSLLSSLSTIVKKFSFNISWIAMDTPDKVTME